MSKHVLLDENLPHKLRGLLFPRTVVTTAFQGWAGMSNGALIAAAEQAGFDVLVTADQGITYQQNIKGRALSLVVLSTNRSSLVLRSVTLISAAIDEPYPVGSPESISAIDGLSKVGYLPNSGNLPRSAAM